MANSGRRAAARASSRFAVLAQAINSSKATIAIRINSGFENCMRSEERAVAGSIRILSGAVLGRFTLSNAARLRSVDA